MASSDKFTLIYLVADILAVVRRVHENLALALLSRTRRKPPPETYRHLQVILPLVELTLDKVQKRAANDQLDPLTCPGLIAAAEACRDKVEELAAVLRGMRPTGTRDRLRRMFRPALRQAKKQKLRQVADELIECDVKVARAGDLGPSEDEVTSMVFDKEVRMDIHFDDVVRRMSIHPAAGLYPTASIDSEGPERSASVVATFNKQERVDRYFNIFQSQVLGTVKTAHGRIPRVFGGRVPSSLTFADVDSNPWEDRSASFAGVAAIQFETARSSRASSIHEEPQPLDAARSKSDASQPSELFSTKSKNSQTSPISPASLVTPASPNGQPKSAFPPQPKPEPLPPKTEPPPPAVHRNPPARFDIPTYASPAPLDPLLAALEDVLFGASMTASLPHAAKQAFHAAVKTLTTYRPTEPVLQLRRLRGLVDAEIGLSLLTAPAEAALARARAHSRAALDLAPRVDDRAAARPNPPGFPRWRTRAVLDDVQLTAREGRVLAKRGDELGATEKRRQAFAAAQEILSTLRGATGRAEDDETLARALVTCGRVVRKVGAVVVQQSGRRSGRWSWGWSGGGGGGRMGSIGGGGSVGAVDAEAERTAKEYFQEAMGAVERGLARDRAEIESAGTRVRMVELRGEVKGLLAGNRGGIILPLHALAQEAG